MKAFLVLGTKAAGKAVAGTAAFRFSLPELSGALGDLGIMLPLVVALITLNGLNATSAFVVIGFAYLMNAFAYRLPIPIQPLKALAATALALGLSVQVISAAAWWMAAIFLLLAHTGAVTWISRLFPIPVVRGIQLGLGLLLLRSAWALIVQPGLGLSGDWAVSGLLIPLAWVAATGAAAILLIGLRLRPGLAGLLVIGYGIVLAVARMGLPAAHVSLSLPVFVSPRLADFAPAFFLLVIPQLPLSLANSVFATSDAARQYFGPAGGVVTPRRLLITMGLANTAAALFGGVPVCHGSGGLTAHYRLGARSGGAPAMIGLAFLVLGSFGGSSLLPLLKLIPYSALGVLLAYVGLQHLLLAKDLHGAGQWCVALTVALVAWFTQNLAWGFASGVTLNYGGLALNVLLAKARLK
jgi:hypothetical protein